MTARQQRALRGFFAASVATLLAATAHTLGGGGAPDLRFVLVVILLAAPVTVALIGRRLSIRRLGATVVAGQALFHLAFAVAGGSNPSAAASGHAHHVLVTLAPAPGAGDTTAMALDAGMLTAHTLAALATIAILYRGERAVRALARGLVRLVRRLIVSLPSPAGLPLRFESPAHRRPLAILVTSVSRRGPPACSATV